MTYFYIKLEVLTMPCKASSFPRSAGLQTDFEQFAFPKPGFEHNPSIHPLLRRDIRKKGTLNRDESMELCTANLGLLFVVWQACRVCFIQSPTCQSLY